MKKRCFFSVAVVLGIMLLTFACSSSAQWRAPESFGESAPMLAGTIWQGRLDGSSGNLEIFQLNSGGELTITGSTNKSNWARNGSNVSFYIIKSGNYYYWNRIQGTFDPATNTIFGTWQNSQGRSRSIVLERYTGGVFAASTPAPPAASISGNTQPTTPVINFRPVTVTVYYDLNGARRSATYAVTASTANEAEEKARRQWQSQFGSNPQARFVSATAAWYF